MGEIRKLIEKKQKRYTIHAAIAAVLGLVCVLGSRKAVTELGEFYLLWLGFMLVMYAVGNALLFVLSKFDKDA